jgi:hypothetical protein
MSVPQNRADFKSYCLRKLGAPVIKINVSDTQVDDRVDEALKFWWDYAIDGSEKIYYKYQVQQADITNQYITLPENIIGAVRIFDVGVISSAIANPFNLNYQIALNDLYTLASSSMIPYYAMMVQLEFIEQMLIGQKPIRFNRLNNILYVDMNWGNLSVGNYLLVEAHQVIDPNTYVEAFGDRLLQNYCTALIKQNWANNIGKMDAVMQGDVKINYQKIMDEAVADIEKYEQIIMDQNIPQGLFLG